MTKWALLAVAGFIGIGCSLSVSGQITQRTDLLALNESRTMNSRGVDLSSLNSGYYGFPMLTLLDGRRLSLANAYLSVEPTPVDFLPGESAEISASMRTPLASELESDYKTVEMKPRLIDYVHGEVSVLYGTSVGSKYSREVEQGYILGEIGTDKYQINVGAFYEHSNAHFPRH